MPDRPHLIARAAEYLTTEEGTPREKLVLGAKLLWAARTLSVEWTPDLLARADNIYRGLLKDGITERTVREMDDKTVKKCLGELTREVGELAAEVERRGSRE